jgi:hypothetical protein
MTDDPNIPRLLALALVFGLAMSIASAGEWHPTKVDHSGTTVCTGTIDRSPSVATTDRQYDIDVCSFNGKGATGKAILSACPEGTRCKIVADGEWDTPAAFDRFYIYHVKSVALQGDELPASFLGDWSNDENNGEPSGNLPVSIGPRSYAIGGQSCQFNSIKKNSGTFLVEMTCREEDDPHVQRWQAIFGMRTINGKDFLIVAVAATKFPSLDVLSRMEKSK